MTDIKSWPTKVVDNYDVNDAVLLVAIQNSGGYWVSYCDLPKDGFKAALPL